MIRSHDSIDGCQQKFEASKGAEGGRTGKQEGSEEADKAQTRRGEEPLLQSRGSAHQQSLEKGGVKR